MSAPCYSSDRARQWFEQWGLWRIFIASFPAIPYKVCIVGRLSLARVPFIMMLWAGVVFCWWPR